MKSYNVKSNAKRFARQLAAKFPEYIVDEPVPVSADLPMEWFPAVAAPTKVLAAGIPEEISSTAYINGRLAVKPLEVGKITMIAHKAELVEQTPTEVTDASKPEAKEARKVIATKGGADVHAGAVAMSFPAMKAALADLPFTKSTPEEIAARRAARAARVAEPKPAKVAKTTKADTIIELVSLKDGATLRDLIAATEWQAHTLRGYIAGTLRKRGHNIVAKRIKGEETRYVIPAVVAEEDEPEAGGVQA